MVSKAKTVFTACQGWGCHDHCILTTYVDEEGNIDRAEPMVVPDHIPEDDMYSSLRKRASICQKGILSVKIPFIKERVRYPMKRIGERNSGQWERISWEQAIDEIAEKLDEIRTKYGSEAVLINNFPCGIPGYPAPLSYAMQYRFLHSFGATKFETQGVDEVDLKAASMWAGDVTLLTSTDSQRIYHSDYVIIWGGNPIGYTRAGHSTKALVDVMDDGVKVVDISILFDTTAAKSSQFIEVNPASDVVLAMAMCNLIIQKEDYDYDFLVERTVAPFLVREDNGKFLREKDLVGGDSENYVVWDSVSQEARVIPARLYDMGDVKADLEASRDMNGIACKTAFLLLKEQLAEWTLEAQESVTGVPPEVVAQLTEEYVAHENATIWLGAGMRYLNSTAASRAIALLPTLTGKLYNEAAGLLVEPCGDTWPARLNERAAWFGEIPAPVMKVERVQNILDSFKNPDVQQYKALINTYSNPVHNWPPRALWEEEFFPNMELVVVFEIRMTETAAFADYVLPDITVFEKEDVYIHGDCIVLQEPAIEPVEEARDQGVIYMELARKLGLGDLFERTPEEWKELRLQTEDPAVATVEPKITLERLRKEKVIRLNTPGRMFHPFKDAMVGTPSGRYEFYVEALAGIPGGALMRHDKALIDDEDMREKYPLHLYIGRSRFFMQGQFREIHELRTLSGSGPRIGMNKDDAKARGICEGDIVEITNDKGTVKVPVHFTNMIQPGMAHLWYAYGQEDYDLSGPATILGAHLNLRESCDEISEAWGAHWRQYQISLGMPPDMVIGTSSNETIWDVLCEIRRAD